MVTVWWPGCREFEPCATDGSTCRGTDARYICRELSPHVDDVDEVTKKSSRRMLPDSFSHPTQDKRPHSPTYYFHALPWVANESHFPHPLSTNQRAASQFSLKQITSSSPNQSFSTIIFKDQNELLGTPPLLGFYQLSQ
ncbi:hypothetical protein TNCV_4445911 [Trichonephila clavipes]|nr:hypothetical protein TNCV_4445911 [Trichonephila clavipes]